MRKINLNIKIPKIEGEENPNNLSDIQIVINWIGNWISRAINCPEIDKQTGRERPTKAATMETQRQYSRIMNALDKEKDGWVKIEDADFDNLIKWWESEDAKLPVQKNISMLLANIDAALQEARAHKGNPE